jgi:ribosomal-protein-alanine N-acetyltransferase
MNEGDLAEVRALEALAPIREEDLRAELLRPWSRLWVAREAAPDEGVGVVGVLVAWHVADEIHILNLVTRVDRRRRGIARALLHEAIAYARPARAVRLLLEVRPSNRAAIILYRTVGFYAFGVRARYYPDDEDAVEMVLTFDPTTGRPESRPDEVRVPGA